MIQKRRSIKDLDPLAYEAMLALENHTKTYSLPPPLKELIKIRASQINGCAYCLDMHTEDALKLGESSRKILAISVWRESHLFSDEERIILQITEEVTNISDHGLTEETYKRVIDHFGENTAAQIIMLIVTINSWNRIAVSTHLIYKK